MKKILLLLILTFNYSNSQDFKEIKYAELDMNLVKEDSCLVYSLKDKLLNGKYKLVYDRPSFYELTQFINGKQEGKSEFHVDGRLKGTKYYRNGREHGLSIFYDSLGNVEYKIQSVNGRKHGLYWTRDLGAKYYIMNKEVTRAEFDLYERNNKKK